jgi:serine/threonine-protein kinase
MREVESQDPFQICGTTIEGKYRITAVVGDGGFGVVYKAVHQGFDEPVAVKCLKLPGKMSAKERDLLLAQLRDEGRLLLRLSRASSGIVQALDVGAFTTAEGLWVPYLILEWLEGDTLAQYVRKRHDRGEGPLSIAEAVKLLAPAARALAVAHAQKVAHRDVKPQNLFLAQVGSALTLKVLDFGIAKVLADHPTFTQALAATNLGPTAFTPRYGAPEQFNKKRGATGPWTDVFALALIVVELASGKQALEGDDPTELYIASADPSIRPTLRSRGIKAPEAVERVLMKALSVEPKHRYADAGEFWDALAAATAEAGEEAAQRPSHTSAADDATGATQGMLGTAEFAAARKLDVSAEISGHAATEASPGISPTLPMTRLPTGTDAPKLAPTVPAEPHAAGLGGAAVGATAKEAATREAATSDAATREATTGAAITREAITGSSATKEAKTREAAAGVGTIAPSQPVSGPTVSVKEVEPSIRPGEPSTPSIKSGEPSSPHSDASIKSTEPSIKPAESSIKPIEPSAGAPAPAAAKADASIKQSDAAASGTERGSSAPAKAAAQSPARRAHDPMAETPLPERAPQRGAVKKSPSAAPPEPAAPAKPPAEATAKPFAAAGDEKRPAWVWIAGGLAAATLAGAVYLALGGGDDSNKNKGAGKGSPTASAISATAAPKTGPKPTAAASAIASSAPADAGADAAMITPPDDMVFFPPGVVKLGAGAAAREVTFSRGFFLDRNEVTVHAYQACLARRMCSAADHVVIPADQEDAGIEGVSSSKEFSETWTRRCNEPRKALDHPINCVDFSNAESFCRFRGRRLPTEAEWERAAQGTDGRAFPWGAEEPSCGRSCFEKNGECLVRGESVTTCTAGAHPNDVTPEGIYDLGGNVSEWVADGFAQAPAAGIDPAGDPSSSLRAVRGASFLDDKEKLRSTHRTGVLPGTAHVTIGLRCAMDIDGGGGATGDRAPAASASPGPIRR